MRETKSATRSSDTAPTDCSMALELLANRKPGCLAAQLQMVHEYNHKRSVVFIYMPNCHTYTLVNHDQLFGTMWYITCIQFANTIE